MLDLRIIVKYRSIIVLSMQDGISFPPCDHVTKDFQMLSEKRLCEHQFKG